MPKDTPNAFLHAPIKMGGMGILQLRRCIPAKAGKKNFLMDAFNENTIVASEVKRFGRPKEKEEPCDPRGLSTAKELYKTVMG